MFILFIFISYLFFIFIHYVYFIFILYIYFLYFAQRLIPDLIDKITSYDHRKKISVPYTYSYGYIKEKCDLHTLLDSTSFPSCFPVLELLSMWFSRALSARERAVEYHSSRQGEELEFIEEIKKVDGEIDDDDDL